MEKPDKEKDGRAVPSRRTSRVLGLGRMAAGIAGSVVMSGAKQLASGQRPKLSDLVLTPRTAKKLTQQLSEMRGAAMKIGQMISMDSGDFLPDEFADILAKLRSDAQHMPRAQLHGVLTDEWGEDWRAQFKSFQDQPMAAASIGQVQRAELPSGERLAIKVQYPGVRSSIDSDVNNVAGLLKMSGIVPSALDIKPLIEEGRRQLHQEADYIREAAYLELFAQLLKNDDRFIVPDYYEALSSECILAMRYIESLPIEDMICAPQERRDKLAHDLIELLLQELFVFGVMQTDPNFANYRYARGEEKIVLLDFGASRDIESPMSEAYKNIMRAALLGKTHGSFDAAVAIGFISPDMPARFKTVILDVIDMALEPLRHDGPFDFGGNDLAVKMRDKAASLLGQKELWHLPPSETVFIQRKIGGMYMLATRLKARVDIRELMGRYVA